MLRVRTGDKATINSMKKCINMLICFFNIKGLVHYEFVPQVQTVNQLFYLEVLKLLREAVRRKRSELWLSGEWLLHHDSAPVHTALSVRQFRTKNVMTTASHLPPQTWHPAIFSCYQEWIETLNESVFRMWRR